MLADPATELLEQASRLPARDAYAMQQKEKVLAYARAVVAENEALNAQVGSGDHEMAELQAETERLKRERDEARALLIRVNDHDGFSVFSDPLPVEVLHYVAAHCQ